MMLKGMITIVHVKGPPDQIGNVELICQLLKSIVSAIKMTPHGEPQVIFYPEDSNAKGTHTVLQPISDPFIAAQYLHESFVIYDNWPELGYAHIIVDSCKPYLLSDVVFAISRTVPDFQIKISDEPVRYGEWVFDAIR